MRRLHALLCLSLSLMPLGRACAQRSLAAGFDGGRTTGASGTLYFDLEVKLPVELRALYLSLEGGAATALLQLYLTPDTRAGKLADPSAWTEALRLELTPGRNPITRAEGFRPLRLEPGNYGCALVISGTGTHYSDGNGRDLVYEDGYLKIECGDAAEGPFSGSGFAPAVWNGQLIYGEDEPRGPFLYVHDGESAVVHGYALDPKTGAPGELLGSPFRVRDVAIGCRGNCQSLIADPDGDFLFAGTTNGLAVLARERGGVLREVAGSPFKGTGSLTGVGAWRRGRLLRVFAAVNQTARVDTFAIDPRTGEAVLQPTTLELGREGDPASLVGLHVGKRFLYAADSLQGAIYGFAMDPRSGMATPIPGSPWDLRSSPPDISNLCADERETRLITNGCEPGAYRIYPIDRRSGALGIRGVHTPTSRCTQTLGFAGKRFYGAGNELTPNGPIAIDVLDRTSWSSFAGPIQYELHTGVVHPKGLVLYYLLHDGTRSALIAQSLDKRTGLAGPRGFSILRGGIRRPPTAAVWVAR